MSERKHNLKNKDINVTVLLGLQHGDEGKGKISKYLSEQNNYDCFIRFNGGPNAGHTIYVNDQKVVLHQIPCGIIRGVPCLIGSSCVVDMDKLEKEAKLLIDLGVDVKELLHIAYNAHIITNECIQEDVKTNKVGTTNCGIGPTYSRKMLRTGTRYIDIINQYSNLNLDNNNCEFLKFQKINNVSLYKCVNPFIFVSQFENIFMEGAQGVELDIDYGDYPYVTSSNCGAGLVYMNGIPINTPLNVIGIAKMYETYVGTKKFQPDDKIFIKLQEIGHEFGATTGRSRQCNWLNLDRLIKVIKQNNVSELYFNKTDIIDELGVFKLISNEGLITFYSLEDMCQYIKDTLDTLGFIKKIIFSGNPNSI